MLQINDTYIIYDSNIIKLIDTSIKIDDKFDAFNNDTDVDYRKDVKILWNEAKQKWAMETRIWVNNDKENKLLQAEDRGYGIL